MMAAILSGHLQWFLRVAAVLFSGFLGRHQCRWVVFIKLQATVFPALSSQYFCVSVFLGISYHLGAAVFQDIFSDIFLLLLIIIFILLSTSVQSLCTRLGLLQLPHTNIIISVRFCVFSFFYYYETVYIDLVVMLLLINLPYIILVWVTLKIFFLEDFNLLFQTNCKIVKTILCNGFKRNVNAMNC